MSTGRKDRWFTIFLALSVAGFLLLSLTLSRPARIVPLWVVAVTLPLLLLQASVDWFPGVGRRFSLNQPRDLFSTETFRRKAPASLALTPAAHPATWPVILWVLIMPLLVADFGILIAIPLHALLFLLIRFKESLLAAVLVAAALGGLTAGALRVLGG